MPSGAQSAQVYRKTPASGPPRELGRIPALNSAAALVNASCVASDLEQACSR
jgi:hypothetical protein